MDIINRKKALVEEFSPMLEKYSKLTKLWIAFLIAVIIIGMVAFVLQVMYGHEITGMRDNVVWGIYIINFIFFVGISYSGAFISGILHFFKTPWKNSISRIVEIMTVIAMVIGPVFILLCIGRLDRLHYLFIYPRIQSPITWDIIAVMTDLIACFLYLYLTFIPDLAILRDNSENLNLPKWQKKMYKFLAIRYQDTPSQRHRLHKITRTMSTIVIVLAIVAYSVLAWIFSLTLQPGWNSTIFAPNFIIAGLYSGISVIIISMYFIRRQFKLEHYIFQKHFVIAGIILQILALLFGYFTFTDYFSKWFSTKIDDTILLNSLFSRYFIEFILANYIGILVPVLVIFFKKLRTVKMITFAAVIALLGLWLNRYLLVVPSLENPFLPIQETGPEYIHYSATWIEYSLSFTGIAAFLLIFTLLAKFVPIIPMSGIIENEEFKAKRIQKKDSPDEFDI